MSVGQPEEIDIAFNSWYNQAQPLEAIMAGLKETTTHLMPAEARVIKNQIKNAFTHGYARGVAAEAAQPLADDPERGPVR